MQILHHGEEAFFACWPGSKKRMQANRKFLHPGRQEANSARQVNAEFAFSVRAKFARDSINDSFKDSLKTLRD